MNQNNEAASTRASGETLSISEAAAALGVSERTVRRRCERGELAASMETGEGGGRVWRVNRAAIAERADSVRTDEHADVRPGVRPHSANENGVRPKRAAKRADSDARVLAAETEARVLREALQREREATARERETGDQWRAQVEAANRDAAEMRAALREALRAMPKPLEGGEYSQGEKSAQDAQEAREGVATGKEAGASKIAPERKPAREFARALRRLLGIR